MWGLWWCCPGVESEPAHYRRCHDAGSRALFDDWLYSRDRVYRGVLPAHDSAAVRQLQLPHRFHHSVAGVRADRRDGGATLPRSGHHGVLSLLLRALPGVLCAQVPGQGSCGRGYQQVQVGGRDACGGHLPDPPAAGCGLGRGVAAETRFEQQLVLRYDVDDVRHAGHGFRTAAALGDGSPPESERRRRTLPRLSHRGQNQRIRVLVLGCGRGWSGGRQSVQLVGKWLGCGARAADCTGGGLHLPVSPSRSPPAAVRH
mmetsp:Transcript_17534/g.43703  ORF Transcript_17534/g.43703 Transcript_17534/m.43703 type:complete len:258 (-) Transcript_17534:2596-3369(-)